MTLKTSRPWAWRIALLAAIASLLSAASAVAAERVALLIGNAAYEHTNRLKNPGADAQAMASALRDLGFEATVLKDADKRAMERALRDFSRASRGADTALLFYSGHGMEIEGRNYLIPTDAALTHPDDAGLDAIDLSDVIAAAGGATRLSVVIVDACRNNTFPASTKSATKGFKPVRARAGQVIAFSTAPGDVALDGRGRLSPYTQALTETLAQRRDIGVRQLFTSLGARVSELAGAEQEPFARFGRFDFGAVTLAGAAPSRPPAPQPVPRQPPEAARSEPPARPPSASAAPVTYEDAVRNLVNGDFDKAASQFTAFIAQNPSHPRASDAAYWLAETHRARDRYDDAARAFRGLLREHPTSKKAPDGWVGLGKSLAALGQTEEACRAFAEAARLHDASPQASRQAVISARRAGCPTSE